VFQIAQQRDHEAGINNLSFEILAWIQKRASMSPKIPSVHVWPHLIDTTPEFKEMKQRICDHFKVKLDPNEKIRKFLFPSINVLYPFFVFHLYFHTLFR
jgi:hypothetical protein